MNNGKEIYVKLGDKWFPATEIDLNVDPKTLGAPSKEGFYKVWPIITLKKLLKAAIEKEEYEEAGVINKVLKMKQG